MPYAARPGDRVGELVTVRGWGDRQYGLGSSHGYLLLQSQEGDWYVNKTIDGLIRYRLVADDRERMIKRLRGMLLFGMGFALLFMALGVASLVVGLRG